ncbi:MAG: ImmA/IrrE family metallo-endopeptidase [Magnetococcales bacterium]|nr:ImmA/IrrE family metallo-endopeptidase [Magnetococcales bacterium]
MPSPIITTLEVLRKQFNISLATLSTETGIGSQRLEEIAASCSPTPEEEAVLSRAFRMVLQPATDLDEPVRLLTLKREFTELDDKARLRVFQLSQDARNLESLRNALSETNSWKLFLNTRDALNLPRFSANQEPWQQGEQLAIALRRALNLGNQPIESMSRLAREHFPGLTVLFGDLGKQGPEGLLLADESRGVTIALNQAAPKNQYLQVRRFNLAHELGHALVDIGLRVPLAHVTRGTTTSQLAVEQRANAFAAYFLCPKQELLNLVDHHQDARRVAEVAVNTYCLPMLSVNFASPNPILR